MSYLFVYEKQKTHLAFTTQGGHITGELMKNIQNISPTVIEDLKIEIAKDNTIGRVIYLDSYAFVIARKHYNTVPHAAQIISMLRSLPAEKQFKTTLETHKIIANVLSTQEFASIEIYTSSDWDYGRAYFKKLRTAQ